jgi:DNA mismatch repair protein MutL
MLAPSSPEPRRIRVLPADVVAQIAAGEVVNGPLSVVRELVDNALDAEASGIDVEVVGGGLGLIRVADNGHGIPSDQVDLAFVRHATSKITSLADLETLQSLGFRGEALPSIAAVAEVSLATCTRSAAVGTLVVATAEGVLGHEQTARQPGTTVTVRHLFGSLPARRKFLEGARSEASRIVSHVKHLALGHPGVRFTLTIDGRPAFTARGLGSREAVLTDVYGARIAASLRTFAADGIEGCISPRTETRPDRQELTLLVNGRLTSTRGLLAALEAGYRPVLPRGRHPVALINVTQPPENVDPNVHPAKTTVRLRAEAEVAERLTAIVRETLALAPDGPAADADFALGAGQLTLPSPRRRVGTVPGRRQSSGPDDQALPAALTTPRSVTQLQRSMVLVESNSGLFLVDQHRAHERVIYERLRASGSDSQVLLEPIVLELQPQQARQVLERLPTLQALGFDCQPFGGHLFLVRSVPAIPDAEDVTEMLPTVMVEAAGPDDRWEARLLASLACRAAVRRGRELNEAEIRRLLGDLAGTTTPAACPHGSPVVLHFSGDFLRHQFRW